MFSQERSEQDWKFFLRRWDPLTAERKLRAYEQIEAWILRAVDIRALEKPNTAVLTTDTLDVLRKRIGARQPVILIDIPGDRPGADIPMYYVVESQRRELRKDDKAVGDVHRSEVWERFGSSLRECAGKVRVFCHPLVVDAIAASIEREDLIGHLRSILEDEV